MPDYSLGRAHGKIDIDYNGDGADRAARDLDKVAASSTETDKSLTKTNKTLEDGQKELEGYATRMRAVADANAAVEKAEKDLREKLFDSKATLEEIDKATQDVVEARKSHAQAAKAASAAEKILSDELKNTQDSLRETETRFQSAGTSADGYRARLKTVESASRDVDAAEKHLKSTLLDSRATLDDVKNAHDRVTESKKRHTQATTAARDAHKALRDEMNLGERAVAALSSIMPNLHDSLEKLTTVSKDAAGSTSGLAGKVGGLAKVVGLLGPEGKAAAAGLLLASKGIDSVGEKASSSTGFITGFAKSVASFEVGFGKIAGMALGGVSLGGLAGLAGSGALQGLVEMADAVKQLSGLLGLLPAAIAGVGFSMGTLQIALRGVGSALTDMMADDPKKFLEDIKDMGPAAAQAMLGVAQFRNQIRMGAGAIQDSFFAQIAQDIAPLIQTWLPAVVEGMSKIAGIFGEAAHQFAGLLQQPAVMADFKNFVDNLAAGLQALEPAMVPLLNIFMELTTVGSSLFAQLGGQISHMLDFFSQIIDKAASSGQLQAWIQDGINAFGHLVNIAYSVGSAFLNIMDIADKFGGGGLLGWLEKLTDQFNQWTQSADGQKTLTDFFTVLRQATDAFTPVLKPLVEGLASIATAFVQLGVATAPGWLTFFNTFAQTMQMMAPQIVAMGPAVNTFLTGMSQAFGQLVATLGPQLPRIMQDMANAFVALLPQIPQLVEVFIQLIEQVGPQLPKFFQAVTDLITELLPYVPELVGFLRDFVSVVTWFIQTGRAVIGWFTEFGNAVVDLAKRVPGMFKAVKDAITGFFGDLGKDAVNWGKNLIDGLIRGITDGLGPVGRAAKAVVDEVSSWFQQSPAKKGPFSGSGYTMVRGQKMVTDMAAGMMSAQSSVAAAAASTAAAASGALGGGSGAGGAGGSAGGAPSPGGASTAGNSLLPDNIAGADTSILTAYLRHTFDDSRGLKGLAKELGDVLKISQDGFNLINTHVVQPMFQALGKMPGAKDQAFRKMTPKEQADKLQSDAEKDNATAQKSPTWNDVLGPGAASPTGGGQVPLGLSASSSKADIQKAIIAAGRSRGMSDSAIQTALAIAADESNFNPTISGGPQGSAGMVSGLYQQSPSSGWGTMEQVNDPNYAINAFYDAFAKNLAKNPNDPLLAGVLTQNPQLGAGAKSSDYWDAVSNKLGEAGSILGTYGKGVTGPSWNQITGTPPPAPGGPPAPPPADAPKPITGAQMKTSGGQTLYNGKPVAQVGGQWYLLSDLVKGTLPGSGWGPPGSAGQTGAPAPQGAPPPPPSGTAAPAPNPTGPTSENGWGYITDPSQLASVGLGGAQLAAGAPATILSNFAQWFNANIEPVKDTAGYRSGTAFDKQIRSNHLSGTALDLNPNDFPGFSGGKSSGAGAGTHFSQEQIAQIRAQLASYGGAIYWGEDFGGGSKDPMHFELSGSSYSNSVGGPANPAVIAAYSRLTGGQPMPTGPTPQSAQGGIGAGAVPGGSLNSGLILPSGQTLGQLTDTSQKNLTVNDKLLQSYLQGNPALAQQIDAAKTPGASDQTVMDGLTGINKTIDTLTAQDAVGNKNTIEALRSQQSSLAQQQGFTQTQSPLATAQSIAGGISNGISGVYQSIQSGLDALTATQDIADRLVYGIRNTEDINKIIDDVQKYYKYAADVIGTAGSIVSTVGSFTGGADMGGTSAAGSALSMISGVLQGINAAIDLGQQIYEVTMSYVGKFASVLTGLGGTDLMGNVGFLLNKNTGQLLSYSMDNPEQKNAANVPSWMNSWYDYNGKGNQNPQVNQQLNIYAGPGQSAGEMMNESMWMVNTGGTTGAMNPTNF